MAARVAAIRRFLADSGQELHEDHRSQTPEGSRRNLPLLGHSLGHDRIAGNAWKVRLLKSLSRRWAKSAITNQSILTACDQIERPGMAGTSVISIEVANSIPANYIGPPKRGDLNAFLGRVGHIDEWHVVFW